MKKGALLFAASALLACLLTTSMATAKPYGMAGCGLGSVIVAEDGLVQLLAVTTNVFIPVQAFAITSGTSNCTEGGVIKVDKQQEMFVEANLDALQADIAAGGGEHLSSLSVLMGCDAGVHGALGQRAQASYTRIFPTESTHPFQALYALKSELSQEEGFTAACTRL